MTLAKMFAATESYDRDFAQPTSYSTINNLTTSSNAAFACMEGLTRTSVMLTTPCSYSLICWFVYLLQLVCQGRKSKGSSFVSDT